MNFIKKYFSKRYDRCHFCGEKFRLEYGPFSYSCSRCHQLNHKVTRADTYFAWQDDVLIKFRAEIYFFFDKPGNNPKTYMWELGFVKPYAALWDTSPSPLELTAHGYPQTNKPIMILDILPAFNVDNVLDKTKTYLIFS